MQHWNEARTKASVKKNEVSRAEKPKVKPIQKCTTSNPSRATNHLLLLILLLLLLSHSTPSLAHVYLEIQIKLSSIVAHPRPQHLSQHSICTLSHLLRLPEPSTPSQSLRPITSPASLFCHSITRSISSIRPPSYFVCILSQSVRQDGHFDAIRPRMDAQGSR